MKDHGYRGGQDAADVPPPPAVPSFQVAGDIQRLVLQPGDRIVLRPRQALGEYGEFGLAARFRAALQLDEDFPVAVLHADIEISHLREGGGLNEARARAGEINLHVRSALDGMRARVTEALEANWDEHPQTIIDAVKLALADPE